MAAGQPPKYDGLCLDLKAEEVTARMEAGEPSVIRMRVPAEGSLQFHDGVYGDIDILWDSVDMQVLVNGPRPELPSIVAPKDMRAAA